MHVLKTIKGKLILSFGFLLIMLIGIGFYAIVSLANVNDKTSEITTIWLPGVAISDDMNVTLNLYRTQQLNHVVADDDARMSEFEAKMNDTRKTMDAAIAQYKELVKQGTYDTEAERQKDLNSIADVEKTWQEYMEKDKIVIAYSRNRQTDAARNYIQNSVRPIAESLNDKLTAISNFNEAGSKQLSAASAATYASTKWTMSAVIVCIVILGIAVTVAMIRIIAQSIARILRGIDALAQGDFSNKPRTNLSQDEFGKMSEKLFDMRSAVGALVKRIANTAEQVAASSQELTASADQSAQVTTQVAQSIARVATASETQVGAVNTTTAAIEQISASIEEVSANAQTSANQASQALEEAQQGNASVTKAVAQMDKIEQTVGESAAVIETLGERSKEIGQIVDTISSIAGQTNLLALNAAIEAARAGEHGKGFAVVAEEVRKLAEQSQEAAEKISTLIGSIQEETQKAVIAMQSGTAEVKIGAMDVKASGEAFRKIGELAKVVAQQVNNIAHTVQEVATGSQEIVGSVKNIDVSAKQVSSETQSVSAATEEQSAAMEEIAASSQSLAKMAQNLQSETRKFTV